MPVPIRAVLFDFFETLAGHGSTLEWLHDAWQLVGRGSELRLAHDVPPATLGAWLDDLWQHATRIDPTAARDLDADTHRRVFLETVATAPGASPELASALYETLPATLSAFDDAPAVLGELQRRGVRTALISNVGFDVRAALDREGLLRSLDAVVLSFEVGVKKPDVEIFSLALDQLDVSPRETLMVGDSWRDDGGAAELGVRTLILPRTRGSVHGLDAVVRLVG